MQDKDANALIRLIRRHTDLSQHALARMAGVSQPMISNIISHKPGLKSIDRIAQALEGLGAPPEEVVTMGTLSAAPCFRPVPQVGPIVNLNELTHALIGHASPSWDPFDGFSLIDLAQEVRRAKADYQACRYSEAVDRLPRILHRLGEEPSLYEAGAPHLWLRLRADAYHVTASVLLKCDARGLAWVAADRSHRAARASQDPVLVGSSARVYVRALMRERHYRTAADLAVSTAEHLEPSNPSPTAPAISVYGSLMLIGAVAAARQEDRAQALSLLAEAEDAARRLGGDHNHQWTAFGPTNVLLHRVSTAVELGDAGQAVTHARQIDPAAGVPVEREVALHLDTARAYAQWGKLREAHSALITAERLAPQELKERPVVHRLISDLRTRSTGHLKRDIGHLAERVGVA